MEVRSVGEMSQCFGSEAYFRYRARIKEAKRECRSQKLVDISGALVLEPASSTPLPPYLESLEVVIDDTQSSKSHGLDGDESQNTFIRDFLFTSADELLDQKLPAPSIFSGVDLTSSLRHLRETIYNFACVMQKMDIIDEYYNVNYLAVLNIFLDHNDVDFRLVNDLRDGVNRCREAMKCLPEDGSAIPKEIRGLLKFMECEKRARLVSCFRHDLRNNLHRYDLAALPDAKGKKTNYLVKVMAIVMGTDILKGLDFV
ncbi:uncharacterized protein [Palaemon carinicauda]|uniref:uncharacterized protein n=1 Tax=Palaemon carinicauda TaxID=392227 RepID=UPI0035B66535